jgi:uncharacterized protein (DUF1330 family)
MNRHLTIGLSMLAGAALGGAGLEALHAQAPAPVYQVTLQDVSDQAALLKEFVPVARAAIVKHGGKVLGSGAPVMLDGKPPAQRVVVNMWPSMEVAKAWYSSPEYQKARETGNKYATFTVMLVPAVAAK